MVRKELEVWVAVDAEGSYESGTNEEEAGERYRDNVDNALLGFRLIKVLVSVPLPGPMTARAVLEEDAPPVASVAN
jgi:hypothetical protein